MNWITGFSRYLKLLRTSRYFWPRISKPQIKRPIFYLNCITRSSKATIPRWNWDSTTDKKTANKTRTTFLGSFRFFAEAANHKKWRLVFSFFAYPTLPCYLARWITGKNWIAKLGPFVGSETVHLFKRLLKLHHFISLFTQMVWKIKFILYDSKILLWKITLKETSKWWTK